MSAEAARSREVGSLGALAGLFLKLGFIGFGGPAAHIAMMEDEVVRRRGWLTREEFLDLVGATNLIPGPNSTEMAIHIGHRRGGWAGLVIAGVCFIVPAMGLVLACAWAYVKFGKLPEAAGVLYGVKPVIIAVVLQALWGLGRSAVKSVFLAVMAAGVAVAAFVGVSELLLLFVAGGVALSQGMVKKGARAGVFGFVPLLAASTPGVAVGAAVGASAFSVASLFWFFLKVGSVLYGSGYVLLAFLRDGLVEKTGWLTETQLLDAIAIGQITPGPVFTTATFIGYLLGGVPAAMAATIGIFLPAFIFVAISGPIIPRIRKSPLAGAFLDGVNVASLALMAVVTAQLGRAAVLDGLTLALAVIATILLVRFKVNSAWLVLGGAIVGTVKMVFW